jgi:hypothetical protein
VACAAAFQTCDTAERGSTKQGSFIFIRKINIIELIGYVGLA